MEHVHVRDISIVEGGDWNELCDALILEPSSSNSRPREQLPLESVLCDRRRGKEFPHINHEELHTTVIPKQMVERCMGWIQFWLWSRWWW